MPERIFLSVNVNSRSGDGKAIGGILYTDAALVYPCIWILTDAGTCDRR